MSWHAMELHGDGINAMICYGLVNELLHMPRERGLLEYSHASGRFSHRKEARIKPCLLSIELP